jgi:hypothetical protein
MSASTGSGSGAGSKSEVTYVPDRTRRTVEVAIAET